MSVNERRPGAKDERGLGICRAALPAKRPEQHVELGRVVAGDPQLVVWRPAQVEDLEYRLELRRRRREVVGIRVGCDRDADERLELPATRAWVDERREARDHAGPPKPPHTVGRGVRAEAHGRPELAPRDPAVIAEQLEDLTVDLVHHRDYLSSWTLR